MIIDVILGAGLALAILGITMWITYQNEDKLMWEPKTCKERKEYWKGRK